MSALDKIIDNQEPIDLSGNDIKTITNDGARVLSYHELVNYSSLDEVLGENQAMILLYETRENFGHWVAVFKVDDDTVEFFDPYGLQMDQELNYATYNNESTLTNLVKASGYKLIVNKVRLQTFVKDINTCGRWASIRIKFRSISLRDFQTLFKTNRHYNPDFWVSALTYLFTYNKTQ
jgi:hypothetical protein